MPVLKDTKIIIDEMYGLGFIKREFKASSAKHAKLKRGRAELVFIAVEKAYQLRAEIMELGYVVNIIMYEGLPLAVLAYKSDNPRIEISEWRV